MCVFVCCVLCVCVLKTLLHINIPFVNCTSTPHLLLLKKKCTLHSAPNMFTSLATAEFMGSISLIHKLTITPWIRIAK